jgi:hypothetical protein
MIFEQITITYLNLNMIRTTMILRVLLISVTGMFCQCEMKGSLQEYDGINGKWAIRDISGGLTGRGFKPKYDILEIDNKMQFSLFRNDTLVSNGRISILDKTSEVLRIEMISKNTEWNYLSGVKNVRLSSDTLLLYDDCCDLYSYLFVRCNK